jgi:hypothetical protein
MARDDRGQAPRGPTPWVAWFSRLVTDDSGSQKAFAKAGPAKDREMGPGRLGAGPGGSTEPGRSYLPAMAGKL